MIETTESFLKIEAVFNEILDREEAGESRESLFHLISQRCAGDTKMIAEVQALLKASEDEERESADRKLEPGIGSTDAPAHTRIGPYEVDRLLGRGGMGAVYLAHRVDGQFDQQVAIKLIDLPLATDVFRERFRQERQILAGLNHPYIARLFDGGVTPNGDLYLAMEFVDGVPINRFCDNEALSIARRLALFKRVCEAVQFAHQNFVVHRDLKPDNILVASDGTPRLLDFGTAKLLSPTMEKPGQDFTRQGFQSYTPQYASPEQILGNPITTASDTYSLGVLLYVLLTGVKPYELKELTTVEMIRVICEQPPNKPGNAIGTSHRLDADLEAILMKAIRKEPQQRYLTAEQFASDIQDYLAGRPVAARRGTFRYRAVKFIRRNRLSLSGAALLTASLSAGIVGVLWQAKIANQERRKADARSADLRQLSDSLLSELDDAIKQLPGSTGVQQLLVTRVLDHLDRMAKDAQGDPPTQTELVDAYTRLGSLQGDPYDQNLGDPKGALASLGKALAIAEPLAKARPNDAAVLHSVANAQVTRSEILFGTGKTPEAVEAMQAGLAAYDRLIADPKAPKALVAEVAAIYGSLGDELGQSGTASLADTEAALNAYRKTIELDHRALAIDPNFLRPRRGLALMQMKIGSVEMETNPDQALKDFQSSLVLVDALPATEMKTLPTIRLRTMILRKEANAMSELGMYTQARPVFEQVLQIEHDFVSKDPKDLRALADYEVILDDEAVGMENAADPALSAGASNAERTNSLVLSEGLYQQVIDNFASMLKQDPNNETWKVNLANAQVHVAAIQERLHQPADTASATKSMAQLKALAEKEDASPMTLDMASTAAVIAEPSQLKDAKFAVSCAERSVTLSHRKSASSLLTLAQAYRASGQLEKSRSTAHEGLVLLPAPRAGATKPRLRKLLEAQAGA